MTPEAGPPKPPPEAQLIRLARDALRISPETAASRMAERFSGARWRQIEAGFRKDMGKPVVAKPATLAHMAHVVGVAPERLSDVGREDAAVILREILEQTAAPPEPAAEPEAPREFQRHYPRLSELVRDRRAELRLTLTALAARCIDPESRDVRPVWTADELDQLERLEPDVRAEPPPYPALQALAAGLRLPLRAIQDAVGVQFYDLTAVEHPSMRVRALVAGWEGLSREDQDRILGIIETWAK